ADEIGRERRQPIILIIRVTVLDRHVLALDIAGFLQALEKRNGGVLVINISGLGAEVANHRNRRLLRPRHHRPRCRTPKPGNELSASHPGILSLYAGAYRGGGCKETMVLAAAGLAALH